MSVNTSKHRSPSFPSTVSLNNPVSIRSFRRLPPPVTTVVTSPPWAKDEPPSPKEQAGSIHDPSHATESRISDVASFQSNPSQSTSRWWTFTLPRQRNDSFDQLPSSPKAERKGFRDISLSWIPTTNTLRESVQLRKEKEKEGEPSTNRPSLHLPPQPSTSFTLTQALTPGWDTPWTPRAAAQGPFQHNRHNGSYGFDNQSRHSTSASDEPTGWKQRKRQFRSFILTHTYVPLLFRFINIAFTTAALAQAIIIRRIEIRNSAMGAVGSSPTVVIIFAPLTLVHVMAAIYLEYFGRPLGLWRTSAKLAHTLSEVLFICLWSAALSLSFDNFFTSLIPCAAPSRTAWYNELPRPITDVPGFEGTLGDRICDHQLSLICLVGVGLIAYCSNLVISLYRIIEKVKQHQPSNGGLPTRTL